ncbi:MAG: cytochrome c biogenesis protein CcsA [Clostridiales bacterium]|jgi:cytochrome c-type biogenesis protein CcsB|nr:cytochrome c biogenesis protein CcsA [Clostridiales bacterium]
MEPLNILFWAVLGLYTVAVALYFTGLAVKDDRLKKYAFAAFVLTTVAHIAYFIWRWWAKIDVLELAFIYAMPMRGAFEFAMSFALVISIIYIVLRAKMPWLASVAMPAALAMMIFAATRNMDIQYMQDALRSPWFFVHAGTGAIAYAGFAIAAVCGIRYLVNLRRNVDEEGKEMLQIDRLSYRATVFGMLFFTVTIISGSFWAIDAWGQFWVWDPKELWSLITWIFYAIYLHQRLRKNWRGRRTAIMSIFGIGLVLFTWIGVNNLLPGLHSY